MLECSRKSHIAWHGFDKDCMAGGDKEGFNLEPVNILVNIPCFFFFFFFLGLSPGGVSCLSGSLKLSVMMV